LSGSTTDTRRSRNSRVDGQVRGGIEYHPSRGEWVRILRSNGFALEALHELYAPGDGDTHQYYEIASQAWAQRWPAEDLWEARRTL
jgi:hypothetical protein